jgi:2,3-bisphosphoglycerate-dependent phosphoglycerate mutase
MGKSFYLIRHCSATGQEPDAPLTEEGRKQAERLADYLQNKGIDAVFCSPWVRAVDSIRPFAERQKLPIQTDSRLIERILSFPATADWRQHLEAAFSDPDMCLPGGESGRTATQRAIELLNEIRQSPAQTPLLISHGNLITLILGHFDATVGFEHWKQMTNPDIYYVLFNEGTGWLVNREVLP